MYNSIYPVNINYSKHNKYRKQNSDINSNAQNTQSQVNEEKENNNRQNTFPNGAKVAIDYTKGQINISQVLTDFRSTILAINAPKDVQDEVKVYLDLVERESKKETPSKDIVMANLKIASKISDNFIAKALNKDSNVVEGWIDALFLQKINLKADKNEINPDFLLEFPKKAQEKIEKENQKLEEKKELEFEQEEPQIIQEEIQENIIESSHEELKEEKHLENSNGLFVSTTETDQKAKDLFIQAKSQPKTNKGDTEAINLLNEALGFMSEENNSNKNIKAAIHMERGKIFDSYDYVDYALRDYWEATKAQDLNLKANAFYKTGKIYDEFREFNPALDNYLSSVAYCGEADNKKAQSKVLSKIAGLYTKQYDIEKTQDFSTLAEESAKDTNDEKLIAKTFSSNAQNYQYLGEDKKAIENYKNALSIFSKNNESSEQIAYNYEQASYVMRRLGNNAKADSLLSKANLYYRKAQLEQEKQEVLS